MISILVVSANNYHRACLARDMIKKLFGDVEVRSLTRDELPKVFREYDLVILDARPTNQNRYDSAIFWSDGMGLYPETHHKIDHEISGKFGRVVLWEFGKDNGGEGIGKLIERVKKAFESPVGDGFENIRRFREYLQNMNFGHIVSEMIKQYPDFINVPYCKEIKPLIEREIDMEFLMGKCFDPALVKFCSSDIDISSLYLKLMTIKDEWYDASFEAYKKKMKGVKPMVTVEIKKVIITNEKTIVIFSDGKKVIITNEKPGVDSLDLFNRIMFAVIKKNVTSKQFEFFCDYCSIPGEPTESPYANNQLQKKMLRAFVKAVIPDKSFWPAWSRYINHLIYELSDKEQKKLFVVQGPSAKEKKKNG